MEGLRMDYRFTAILILARTMLALFAEPAYPRNEYLNEYGSRCGDFETRIEKEDRNNDYRHYSNNNKTEIVNLQRDLKVAQEKLTDQNTRLTSAESTWQMAENLYRQLADQVREHSYDIKDLNR